MTRASKKLQSQGRNQDDGKWQEENEVLQWLSRLEVIKRACKSYLRRKPLGPHRVARIYRDEQMNIWIGNYAKTRRLLSTAQRKRGYRYIASVDNFADGFMVFGETRVGGLTAQEAIAKLLKRLGKGSRSLKVELEKERRNSGDKPGERRQYGGQQR